MARRYLKSGLVLMGAAAAGTIGYRNRKYNAREAQRLSRPGTRFYHKPVPPPLALAVAGLGVSRSLYGAAAGAVIGLGHTVGARLGKRKLARKRVTSRRKTSVRKRKR